MSVTFQIHFDRPHAAYFAGETISGRVVMNVAKKKKIRAVSFHFKGEAHVRWSDRATVHRASSNHSTTSGNHRTTTTTMHTETVHYAARETYFDKKMYFLGHDSGEMEIDQGEYAFAFECPLPAALPSSFEGAYGHIRYTAKAVMHRPWKFDHGAKAAFTVVSTCDLNGYLQAKEPILVEQSKHVCCLWCRSGPVTVIVSLPAGGYVPGQAMLLQIQVDNASRSPVEAVACSFKKEVKWHAYLTYGSPSARASRQKTKVTQTKLASCTFQEVPARSSRNYSQIITVPPVPPSNLDNCGIIDLQYILKVTAVMGSCSSSLAARIPILIGTIPLRPPGTPFLLPARAPAPAAENATAPPYSPSTELPDNYGAPPAYEECVFKGNNIMDPESGDNEYTMGIQDFTPRYPVYPFSPPAYMEADQEVDQEAIQEATQGVAQQQAGQSTVSVYPTWTTTASQ